MFPVEFSHKAGYMMLNSRVDELKLWHCRYGHLHEKGLKLLSNKQMVNGLPAIHDSKHVCEGCVLGKQSQRYFPKGKAR